MKDISVLVSRVGKKAEKLIEKQILLKEKNQQILELNNKVKLLKIAGSVGEGESTREVKLKINEMVREIDKCIAQINR